VEQGWSQVDLGGVGQWVSVRGRVDAALLLVLHGGPGGAEYGPRRHYLAALEQRWLVVEWEQRGAGRSFRGDETAETLSLDLLVRDAVELVERLRVEHPGRPLVVLAHSFGTVLGVRVAQRVPGLVDAYVGVGQVVCWALQEQRSYDWALAEARRQGNAKAVAALERIGPPVDGEYASGRAGVETQRRWLGTLGGVTADPSFLMAWVRTILLARDYPLRAKLRFSKGMARSMDLVWPQLCATVDLGRDVPALDVPVYLVAGGHDRITGLDQVQPWFDALRAPAKRLEVLDDVGHLSLYEAPDRFLALMEQVRRALPS
jgi:pimeloyl-ACP methyl ester carboxylesterase